MQKKCMQCLERRAAALLGDAWWGVWSCCWAILGGFMCGKGDTCDQKVRCAVALLCRPSARNATGHNTTISNQCPLHHLMWPRTRLDSPCASNSLMRSFTAAAMLSSRWPGAMRQVSMQHVCAANPRNHNTTLHLHTGRAPAKRCNIAAHSAAHLPYKAGTAIGCTATQVGLSMRRIRRQAHATCTQQCLCCTYAATWMETCILHAQG